MDIKLNPTQPPANGREARETVDPNVRQKLRDLGFDLDKDEEYDAFKAGWLWCLPVYIAWYGVPQAAPDFSVQFDTGLIQQPPGSVVNTSVTYKLNADHPQPETAKLELFQQREDGSLVQRITPPDGEIREFSPGETHRVPIPLTMPTIDTDIMAEIRPISTGKDRDWDNNWAWLPLWPDEGQPEPLPDGSKRYETPTEESKIHGELIGSGKLNQIKLR